MKFKQILKKIRGQLLSENQFSFINDKSSDYNTFSK